jgi:Outer membrane protein beta-barrel domain
MKTISRVLAALILVATAGVASAQMKHKAPMESGYYGEVGYLPLRFSDQGSVTPDLARLVIGKDIDKNLSIEGMVGATVSKDSGVSGNTFGLFAKPKMDVSKDTQIFARIGLARTTVKAEDGYMNAQTKVAYGIGAQTQINKDVYGQVDYINYMNKDGLSARGLTFSVGSRF